MEKIEKNSDSFKKTRELNTIATSASFDKEGAFSFNDIISRKIIKISLVGTSKVGKTFLIRQIYDESLKSTKKSIHEKTLGDIYDIYFHREGNLLETIRLYDTPSLNDNYSGIMKHYAVISDALIFVVDLKKKRSLEKFLKMKNDLSKQKVKEHIINVIARNYNNTNTKITETLEKLTNFCFTEKIDLLLTDNKNSSILLESIAKISEKYFHTVKDDTKRWFKKKN